MVWGHSFKADIFISRQCFQNEYQIDDRIREVENELTSYKQQLLMYAIANPKDIIPDDWKEEVVRFIKIQIDEIVSEHEQLQVELYKLQLLKENFDNQNNNEKETNS